MSKLEIESRHSDYGADAGGYGVLKYEGQWVGRIYPGCRPTAEKLVKDFAELEDRVVKKTRREDMKPKKKWETVAVGTAILAAVPEVGIESIGPNEDRVTQQIVLCIINLPGMYVYVRGFRTDDIDPATDDDNVEMVEVTSGNSDGDLPQNPDYVITHAKVTAAVMSMGYQVVRSMNPYF